MGKRIAASRLGNEDRSELEKQDGLCLKRHVKDGLSAHETTYPIKHDFIGDAALATDL